MIKRVFHQFLNTKNIWLVYAEPNSDNNAKVKSGGESVYLVAI
jgi:hypothetical protein